MTPGPLRQRLRADQVRPGMVLHWHEPHEVEEVSPPFHGSVLIKLKDLDRPWDFECDHPVEIAGDAPGETEQHFRRRYTDVCAGCERPWPCPDAGAETRPFTPSPLD